MQNVILPMKLDSFMGILCRCIHMCVSGCVTANVYMFVWFVCVWLYMYKCLHDDACIYLCDCVYNCTCMYVCINVLCAIVHICVCDYICVIVHLCMYLWLCICVWLHVLSVTNTQLLMPLWSLLNTWQELTCPRAESLQLTYGCPGPPNGPQSLNEA